MWDEHLAAPSFVVNRQAQRIDLHGERLWRWRHPCMQDPGESSRPRPPALDPRPPPSDSPAFVPRAQSRSTIVFSSGSLVMVLSSPQVPEDSLSNLFRHLTVPLVARSELQIALDRRREGQSTVIAVSVEE